MSDITQTDEEPGEKRGRGRPRSIITLDEINSRLPKIAGLPADEFEQEYGRYLQILQTMTLQEIFKKLPNASPTNLSAMLKTLGESKAPVMPVPKPGAKIGDVSREDMLKALAGESSKAPNYLGLVSNPDNPIKPNETLSQ